MKHLWLFVTLIWLGQSCSHKKDPLGGYPYFEVKVERGDTLASLGKLFHVPWQLIAYSNDISDHRRLQIGQVLHIPQTELAWESQTAQRRLAGRQGNKINMAEQSDSFPARGFLFSNQDSLYWPLEGAITSHYGPRGHRHHYGVDIRGATGTPIRSVAAGRVVFSGWQRGYGRTVIVRHDGYKSLYAHCSRLDVKVGQQVERGQVIALVGASGRATGPHLHFELRTLAGRPVNPLNRDIAVLFGRQPL